MSPQKSSKTGGPYRRPQADVYTVLLLLTLFALILGIVCLYFEQDMYNFELKGGPTVSAGHTAHYAPSTILHPLSTIHYSLTPGTDAPSPA